MALLIDVIRSGNYTLATRARVLDSDLVTVLSEVPGRVLDGSVGFERGREVPRQGAVVISNDDGAYTALDTSSLTWPGRIWRLERGAIVDGSPQYEPLVTGVVTEYGEDDEGAKIALTLWSRLSIADQQFSAPVSFPVQTRVRDVIRDLLELGGLGTNDDFYSLDDNFATLQAVRAYTTDENILEEAHAQATANGLELWENGLGVVILQPFVDPSTRSPDFTFEEGDHALLLGETRKLTARRPIYNRANVRGVGPDMYPIEAEARDLNPASPTYNPVDGSGPMGDRPRPAYVSADVRTQAQANAAALRLLYEGALADEVTDGRAMPFPFITERTVVQFPGDVTNYLLDRVSTPLQGGDMTFSTRRIRSLIAP